MTAGPDTRRVLFILFPSYHPGICANAADPEGNTRADYAFVRAHQPDRVRAFATITPETRPTKRNGGPSQTLEVNVDLLRFATYSGSGGEFEAVIGFTVTVTSFDYGGQCVVLVAENIARNVVGVVRAPLDTDNDLLPDRWERDVTGSATSPLSGEHDNEVWPGQTEAAGDGHVAFVEFRGAIFRGEHARFNEVASLFDPDEKGGPGRIDLFLLDVKANKEGVEQLRNFAEKLGPHPGFKFAQVGAIFHRLRDGEADVPAGAGGRINSRLKQEGYLVRGLPGSGIMNLHTPVSVALNPALPNSVGLLTRKADVYAIRVLFETTLLRVLPTGTRQRLAGEAFGQTWNNEFPVAIDTAGIFNQISARSFTWLDNEDNNLQRCESRTALHELGHRLTLSRIPMFVPKHLREIWERQGKITHPFHSIPRVRTVEGLRDLKAGGPDAAIVKEEGRAGRARFIGITIPWQFGRVGHPPQPLAEGFMALRHRDKGTQVMRLSFGFGKEERAVRAVPGDWIDANRRMLRWVRSPHEVHTEVREPPFAAERGAVDVYVYLFQDKVMDGTVFFESRRQYADWEPESRQSMRVK